MRCSQAESMMIVFLEDYTFSKSNGNDVRLCVHCLGPSAFFASLGLSALSCAWWLSFIPGPGMTTLPTRAARRRC